MSRHKKSHGSEDPWLCDSLAYYLARKHFLNCLMAKVDCHVRTGESRASLRSVMSQAIILKSLETLRSSKEIVWKQRIWRNGLSCEEVQIPSFEISCTRLRKKDILNKHIPMAIVDHWAKAVEQILKFCRVFHWYGTTCDLQIMVKLWVCTLTCLDPLQGNDGEVDKVSEGDYDVHSSSSSSRLIMFRLNLSQI